ncbi:hypothetical protein [Methylocucumis oryzae]|nr:hypothetical protein [Methylocucumis oryzae]
MGNSQSEAALIAIQISFANRQSAITGRTGGWLSHTPPVLMINHFSIN